MQRRLSDWERYAVLCTGKKIKDCNFFRKKKDVDFPVFESLGDLLLLLLTFFYPPKKQKRKHVAQIGLVLSFS